MQISKSEYIMFLKHPAWLWLKKHDKSKLPEPDANLQAIFDSGKEFEKYAEKRFPNGVQVGFESFKDYMSMPKRTQEAIDSGAKIIFQGRFEGDNITCICDVLEKTDEGEFNLYEIKSSTKTKPEHCFDLAFQTVVLESAGLKVNNIAVVHVNNQYVKNGEIDPVGLSTITDVTSAVRDKIDGTRESIGRALDVVNNKEMPDPSPRFVKLGALGEWMEIYKALGKKVDKYSIYNLIAPGVTNLGQLEDLGIEHIKDIPDDFKLTAKQQAQVRATKSDEQIIDKNGVREFLDTLTYPLYFLDYETTMGTVPMYDETKPYQQVPFQYSLHIVKKKGDEPVQLEYLHRESDNPIPSLLKRLKEDIGSVGSVIVWYKSFEMKRNEEMAEMYPEYAEFLEGVNERVVDLMEPFSNGLFVDKDFSGSSSIKKVLPVLVPELSYKELDIQEGASAQRLWTEAVVKGSSEIDKEKLFSDLIEYCKLDTLAMVKIWEALENL
ncbi:MAG: DUF2779 domain-containing protein [Candidatus Paceibacteria bacterium]